MTEPPNAPSLEEGLARIPAKVDAMGPMNPELRQRLLLGMARRLVWLSVHEPHLFERECRE